MKPFTKYSATIWLPAY